MIKTFSVLFLILEGIPEGVGSKGLETHSNKLRFTVSLPKKVADLFEKKMWRDFVSIEVEIKNLNHITRLT